MRDWFEDAYARPPKSGLYDVLTERGTHAVLNYSARHDAWNQHDDLDANEKAIEVAAWAHRESTKDILHNMIRRKK